MPDEILALPTLAAWRRWLATHHASHPAVWLKLAKEPGTTKPSAMTYARALDVALA